MSEEPPIAGKVPIPLTRSGGSPTVTAFGPKTEAAAPATVGDGGAETGQIANATEPAAGGAGVETLGVDAPRVEKTMPVQRVFERVKDDAARLPPPAPVLRKNKRSLSIGALGETVELSVAMQDLSRDEFIVNAPRMQIEGRAVPALGGIPLLAKLGQGGMGAVYYGIHPGFGREVAIKVLPFHLAQKDPDLIQRFFREARIAARVNSAHLVGVTDVAQESGISYLVMEFVSGKSAAQDLKLHRLCGAVGLPERMALELCIAACQGLADAHAANIVHRDIKPDNILIPYSKGTTVLDYPSAKLADLGLARSEEFKQSLTSSQNCMGTPGYMSPEQIEDTHTVGPPADVFSMGATLYALLCGEAPFEGDGSLQIFRNTSSTPHVSVRARRIDVSKSTAAVVDMCLAKLADYRYQDGAGLLKALKACHTALIDPQAAQCEDIHVSPPRIEVPKSEKSLPTLVSSPPPKRLGFAAASVAALALAGGIYWILPPLQNSSHPGSPPRFDPKTDAGDTEFDNTIIAEDNRIREQKLELERAKMKETVKANEEAVNKRRIDAAARAEFEAMVEQARDAAGIRHEFARARALLDQALASPGAALSPKKEEARQMLAAVQKELEK